MPVVQDVDVVASVVAAGRTPPADVTAPVLIVVGWVCWIAALVAVVRLLWIAGKFGFHRWSGSEFDHSVTEIVMVLFGAVVASGAGGWVAALQR